MKRLALALSLAVACGTEAAGDPYGLKALNALRVGEGVGTVAYSDQLEKAAARHARDMSRAKFFSHRGSDGSDVARRVTRTGYRWCWVAENIAQGHGSLRQVMYGWENSPEHRANMLSSQAQEFALARTADNVWVMVLARKNC